MLESETVLVLQEPGPIPQLPEPVLISKRYQTELLHMQKLSTLLRIEKQWQKNSDYVSFSCDILWCNAYSESGETR